MWLHGSPPTLADGLVREVVSAHVRSLQVDHLTDVGSPDTHTLKPWLSDQLAFAPRSLTSLRMAFSCSEHGWTTSMTGQ